MDFNQENFNKLLTALNYTGVEVDSNLSSDEFLDGFKKGFLGKFITVENAKTDERISAAVFGKKAAEYEQGLKKRFKTLGFDFEPGTFKNEEGENLKGDEYLDKMFGVVSNKFESQLNELKEKAVSSLDTNYKKLESKYQELEVFSKQKDDSISKLQQQLEQEKNGRIEFERNVVKKDLFGKAISQIEFVEMDEIRKKGFDALISEKIKWDLAEEGEAASLVPLDAKTGKRFENPNRAGDFLGAVDVLKGIAEQNGLIKKNEGEGNKPIRQTSPTHQSAGRTVAKPVL